MDELSARERPSIEFHLLNCEHCISVVERKLDRADSLSWTDHSWIVEERRMMRDELALPKCGWRRFTGAASSWFDALQLPIRIPAGYTLIFVTAVVFAALTLNKMPGSSVEYFGPSKVVSSLDLQKTRSLSETKFEAEMEVGQLAMIVDYAPYDTVRVSIRDEAGAFVLEEMFPTENQRVNIPLRFSSPGLFQILLYQESAPSPFVEYELIVVPAKASTP